VAEGWGGGCWRCELRGWRKGAAVWRWGCDGSAMQVSTETTPMS